MSQILKFIYLGIIQCEWIPFGDFLELHTLADRLQVDDLAYGLEILFEDKLDSRTVLKMMKKIPSTGKLWDIGMKFILSESQKFHDQLASSENVFSQKESGELLYNIYTCSSFFL